MDQVMRLWGELGPEARSFLAVTLAGVLGGLASAALEKQVLVLPRLETGRLRLGFVGTVLVSLVAAHAVDHGFSTALVGAVCGAATLRRLKAEIDRGFERGGRRPGEGRTDE
jgi:hypothetical protein